MKNEIDSNKKNTKLSIILYITFLGLCLPLYYNNNLMTYLEITNGLTIFHVFSIIELIYILIRFNTKRLFSLKNNLLFILLLIIQLFAIIIGYFNNHGAVNYIYIDIRNYIYPIIILIVFVTVESVNNFDIKKILDFLLYSTIICTFFNVFMLLTSKWTFWGLSYYGGNRLGGSYLSNNILVIGYSFYVFFNNKSKRLYLLIYYCSLIYSLIIAQSRALLGSVFLIIVISIILFAFEKRIIKKDRLLIFVLLVISCILFIPKFLSSNYDIVERLNNITILSNDQSYQIRKINNAQTLKKILENPIGYGFGSLINNYHSDSSYASKDLFIDNSIFTIGYKYGIVGICLYSLFMIIVPIFVLIKKIKIDVTLKKIIVLSYIIYILNTCILTAQSINSINVSTALWIFLSYIVYYRLNLNGGKYDEKNKITD